VQSKPLAEQGLRGEEIGKALHQERVKVIGQIKSDWRTNFVDR